MGQHISSFKHAVQDQFAHVKEQDQTELNFLQLNDIVQPRSRFYVNPRDVVTLYQADADKNGRFSLPDLLNFVDVADAFQAKFDRSINFNTSFAGFFRAYCSLLLVNELQLPQGRENIIQWLYKLVLSRCIEPPQVVNKVRYWHGSVATSLYVLALKDFNTSPVADYLAFQEAMLKSCTDHQPLQLGAGTSNDDLWVPESVLEDFFNGLINGFVKVVDETSNEIDIRELAEFVARP